MRDRRVVIHIFRRDLRVSDNNSLNSISLPEDILLPLFIVDPMQIKDHQYFSQPALAFMIESLRDLSDEIEAKGGQLYLGYGKHLDVLERLIKQLVKDHKCTKIKIQFNRDYTPFSRKRDKEIEAFCRENNLQFDQFNDVLLTEPEQIRKSDGGSYSVYSAFARKAKEFLPALVTEEGEFPFFKKRLKDLNFQENISKMYYSPVELPAVKGGRKAGLKLLATIAQLKNYEIERDIPFLDKTSHLSAHNKFGTISIRELYWKICETLGRDHRLIGELFWRDFFTHIAFNNPHVFQGPYRKKYIRIDWQNNENEFQKWCEGNTGFPIVDAGMRELNRTGYMHNRVRMITASFLVKDLHIDWRWGEGYFARHLIDYDPSVNNGNWQWCASTGCDAQPYFRIFNPWRQQKRFDPDCLYIKKWIPQLRESTPKQIHDLIKSNSIADYPEAICDHKSRAEEAKKMFKEITF